MMLTTDEIIEEMQELNEKLIGINQQVTIVSKRLLFVSQILEDKIKDEHINQAATRQH